MKQALANWKNLLPEQKKLLEPLIQVESRELRKELARKKLIPFSQFIDPNAANEYAAPHLNYIAHVLEDVEAGKEKRVIINSPPRHWKTSILEKFCAWYLGRHPLDNIIYVSYAADLPVKSSRYIRDTIDTNWLYHEVFPDIHLDKGTRDQADWKLIGSHRSTFRAKGVFGGVTGGGANLLIIDDPIKDWKSSRSETILESTWDWIQKTLLQRQEPLSAIVMLMTRWSADDPTARALRWQREEGGLPWTVVRLPAYAEADDPLGREPGEALWEDRWSRERLQEIEREVGDLAWKLTYQQDDGQDQGLYIKKEWFKYWDALPVGADWTARAWDLALTEKQTVKSDPDYTASVKGTTFKDNLWLGGSIIFRARWSKVVETIMSTMIEEPNVLHATGKAHHETAAVQALLASGYWLDQYEEYDDPLARASAWINQASIGRVQLVGTESEWQPFVKWWWRYPAPGSKQDSIDCTSGLAKMLGFAFIEDETNDQGRPVGLSLDRKLKAMFNRR